ncbi:SDR family oxidoreductase [Mycobacterium sp. SMC-2]|uniref:SDR family NAD(P)-dependent oxidoreductase n=1 Tax=Mycobacterium sp. SMC-2 TaxID=2857058 RepID=UPI0021B2AC7E|nr:SDR family oxidoreductase [Mycobacterium sp. SMC-2]UXA08328.1 SDR family oxidoreductase [Mycobacterium sp. SMC-2]
MTDRLKGKVAIVTGAGSGIGAATAFAMTREGAAVVAADINGDSAGAVVEEINSAGGSAVATHTDVTKDADVANMVKTAIDEFGRLDIIHNNAGAAQEAVDTDVVNTPDSAWRLAHDVDLMGVVLGCRHAIPEMTKTGGGSVIITASAGPFFGSNQLIAYAAAKAAALAVTKYVATSHGRQGIRCNAIAPGLVLTPGAEAVFPSRKLLDAISRHQTLEGFIRPDDVANLAVFLASDESRFITGQTLIIDAGSLTMGSAVPDIDDAIRELLGG